MGPMTGYTYRESNYKTEDNRIYTNIDRMISAGISLNLGIEYNLTNRFFLLADYHFQLSREWYLDKSITKYGIKSINERDIKRTRYDLKNIRVGIGFKI